LNLTPNFLQPKMTNDESVLDFITKISEFQRNPPPDLVVPYFIIPTRATKDIKNKYENHIAYLPNRWSLTREEFVTQLYKNQKNRENVITYLSELGLVSTDVYGNINNGRHINRSYISLNFSPTRHPEISVRSDLMCTSSGDETSPLSLATDCSEEFNFTEQLDEYFDSASEAPDVVSLNGNSVTSDSTIYRDFQYALSRRKYSASDLEKLSSLFGKKAHGKEWKQLEKLKAENNQLKLRLEEMSNSMNEQLEKLKAENDQLYATLEQMRVPFHIAEQLKDAINLIYPRESESEHVKFLLDCLLAATVPDHDDCSILTSADVLRYYGAFNKNRITKATTTRKSLKSGDLTSFMRLPSRRKRVDNVNELMFSYVHDFCHDDDESRIDTNGKLVRCCKSDGTKDYEQKHAIRNWRHAGDLKVQFERFKTSQLYSKYQCELREIEYWKSRPDKEPLTFSKFKTFLNRIPCLQDPTDASCVDDIKVAANESFESLRKFTIDCCRRRGITTNDTMSPPTSAASSETLGQELLYQSKSCQTCKD
jgi:DNA-binding transcriptional MerR regulator